MTGVSKRRRLLREHYHQFFNLNRPEGYDLVEHPDYSHNGAKPKRDGGSGLKSIVNSWHKAFDPNVNIVIEIEEDDFLAIYWVSNPTVAGGEGNRLPPMHGINVYRWDGDKIIENYHVKSTLYEPMPGGDSVVNPMHEKVSPERQIVREHYLHFFNRNDPAAYDMAAHPKYTHNRIKPKSPDGSGLKAWVDGLHKVKWPNVNLAIEIEETFNAGSDQEEKFVGVYWVSNGVTRDTGQSRLAPNHGFNVYRFKDDRIFENFHAKGHLYEV